MVHVIAFIVSTVSSGVNDWHFGGVNDWHCGGVDDWHSGSHCCMMYGWRLIVGSWAHNRWRVISGMRHCRTDNSCLVIRGVSDSSTNDHWLVVGDMSADGILISLVVVLWMGVDRLVVDSGCVDDRLIVVRNGLVLDWLVGIVLVLDWLVVDMLVVDGLVVGVLVVNWLVSDGLPVLWLVCCGLVVLWLVGGVLVMNGLVSGVLVVFWHFVVLNSSVDFVVANIYGRNMTLNANCSDVSINDVWFSVIDGGCMVMDGSCMAIDGGCIVVNWGGMDNGNHSAVVGDNSILSLLVF